MKNNIGGSNRLIDERSVSGSYTPCPLEVRRGGEGTLGLPIILGEMNE